MTFNLVVIGFFLIVLFCTVKLLINTINIFLSGKKCTEPVVVFYNGTWDEDQEYYYTYNGTDYYFYYNNYDIDCVHNEEGRALILVDPNKPTRFRAYYRKVPIGKVRALEKIQLFVLWCCDLPFFCISVWWLFNTLVYG